MHLSDYCKPKGIYHHTWVGISESRLVGEPLEDLAFFCGEFIADIFCTRISLAMRVHSMNEFLVLLI